MGAMTLLRRDVLRLAAGAAIIPWLPRLASAQAYPARPVRVIVPVAAGGQNDTATRLVMQKVSEAVRQQFYVENVVGAGGNIGMGQAARAAADGYTLLAAAGSFIINPSLYARVPYDPISDFAPVSLMCSTTHVLVVHPSVAARSIKELVALAKASPGKLSYASAGTGTPAHLAGELFKTAFGLDITHVPFTGGGPGITSTIGGHTPMSFSALATAAPNVKAGGVRALAVMSGKRSSVLPEVPTMAEASGADLQADVISGILVRAGTPREVIDRLHGEIVKVIGQPEVRDRLVTLGFEPVANTPGEFAEWIKIEIAKWANVIHEANIRIQ